MLDLFTSVIINILIFIYVLELEKEKCRCSRNWMRDFIKIVSLFFVIVNIILILFFSTAKSSKQTIINLSKNNLAKIFLVMYLVLAIFYWITCMVYFFKLKKRFKCECSEDWKKYMLLTPMIILSTSFLFIVIIALFFLIFRGFKRFL